MASNLCVAVGVSKYSPGLQPLPGAVRAAEDFVSWAEKTGYHSLLITDSGSKPVTIQLIKDEMERLLGKVEVKRLIFFFAGHGTVSGAADDCWLLSNVLQDPEEVISRLAFQRQLTTYRIPQIAFFVDACRTVTNLGPYIRGRGVLSNSGADRLNPQLDTFLACSLGHPALSIQGAVPSQDRCLFTEVVLEGLSGNAEAAIEKCHHAQAPAVVSHTLANFVESEAENRASLLNRINRPEIQAAFRAPEDVYLKIEEGRQSAGSHPPPDRPIVPAPDTYREDAVRLEQLSTRINQQVTRDALDQVFPDFMRWFGFGRGGFYQEELLYPLRDYLNSDSGAVAWSAPPSAVALPPSSSRNRFLDFPFPWPASGLRMRFTPGSRSTLMLVMAENGDWSALPVFPRLLAIATLSTGGLKAFTYLGQYSFEAPEILRDYSDILGPLSAGQLRPSDANRIADRVRPLKHVNPLFGVVAAYLYAASGDIDNIIRMADYYFNEDQPVPFDIALLGASHLRWISDSDNGFKVFADFKAVPEVKDNTDKQSYRPYFARHPFPAANGIPVSGCMPWLRQGWPVLTSDKDLEVPEIVREMSKQLRSGPFTTISGEAGHSLAKALGYRTINL